MPINIPYYKDTIHVSNPDSSKAILSLWTRKESIIPELKPDQYSFIGQLYSKQYGLEILTRNLLANNSIRDIVITGIDLNDVAPGLFNLFNKGITEEGNIEGTDIHLSEPIQKHIDILRRRVTLHDARTTNNFQKINSVLQNIQEKPGEGKEITLDLPETIPPTRFPTDFTGYKIRRHSFRKAWKTLLRYILTFGVYSPETKRLSAYNLFIHITEVKEDEQKVLEHTQPKPPLHKQHVVDGEEHNMLSLNTLECWHDIRSLVHNIDTNKNITITINHAYLQEDDLERAIELTQKRDVKLRDPDPHGNLLIRVEDNTVKLLHLNQQGRVIDEYHSESKKDLFRYIEKEMKISLLDHALDIGAEIQKAITALRTGKEYSQDKELTLDE